MSWSEDKAIVTHTAKVLASKEVNSPRAGTEAVWRSLPQKARDQYRDAARELLVEIERAELLQDTVRITREQLHRFENVEVVSRLRGDELERLRAAAAPHADAYKELAEQDAEVDRLRARDNAAMTVAQLVRSIPMGALAGQVELAYALDELERVMREARVDG